ncbi:MAG: hypothetical protein D6795_05945 [Deltaproteobacteria bacterium]|nr:MAG: hypothetical protein D6795_05945 [Deltaproteobacteria bacterium]
MREEFGFDRLRGDESLEIVGQEIPAPLVDEDVDRIVECLRGKIGETCRRDQGDVGHVGAAKPVLGGDGDRGEALGYLDLRGEAHASLPAARGQAGQGRADPHGGDRNVPLARKDAAGDLDARFREEASP